MPSSSSLPAQNCPRPRAFGDVPATHRAAVALPAQAERVRTVRHFISRSLAAWGVSDDDREAAMLIVSELAGNAAWHGRTDMKVVLALAGSALHLVVADYGAPADDSAGRSCAPEEQYGRGLGIVHSLAERLTISPGPEGWQVAAVLRTGSGRRDHGRAGTEGECAVTDTVAGSPSAEAA